LLGSGENGAEVVARMAEAARRHVAVEQIYVTHQAGVEERRLIGRRPTAADQGASAGSAVLLELFAQRLEGLPWERGDGAAEAVKNIAFEQLRISTFRCRSRAAAANVACAQLASCGCSP